MKRFCYCGGSLHKTENFCYYTVLLATFEYWYLQGSLVNKFERILIVGQYLMKLLKFGGLLRPPSICSVINVTASSHCRDLSIKIWWVRQQWSDWWSITGIISGGVGCCCYCCSLGWLVCCLVHGCLVPSLTIRSQSSVLFATRYCLILYSVAAVFIVIVAQLYFLHLSFFAC